MKVVRSPGLARQTPFARSATTVPVGRVVQPEDVAQVFLIQNSFMRGTILDCVGGARIK
jgi:hypothetical protein